MTHNATLVLLRHGQSVWNKENIFTGWVDIPLSPAGLLEAQEAGKQLYDVDFNKIFVSKLLRAKMTACIAMQENSAQKIPFLVHESDEMKERFAFDDSGSIGERMIPMIEAWQLNERFYGDLQGQNKDAMRAKYGKEQVKIWRRSFKEPPPKGESLAMTVERTIPYFQEAIAPLVKEGQNILVSAHGNSLRSIVMHLENMSQEEILEFEIPTGQPLIYRLVDSAFKRVQL
jgi:2,3-bisphosphoglycerate-dependent phosphoglycerate mutase